MLWRKNKLKKGVFPPRDFEAKAQYSNIFTYECPVFSTPQLMFKSIQEKKSIKDHLLCLPGTGSSSHRLK